MPQVKAIADWNEVMSFEVKGRHEYEEFQRWAMNKYAFIAAKTGDERLDWLGETQLSNNQALKMAHPVETLRPFKLMANLRNMIPEGQRSDETLMARRSKYFLDLTRKS